MLRTSLATDNNTKRALDKDHTSTGQISIWYLEQLCKRISTIMCLLSPTCLYRGDMGAHRSQKNGFGIVPDYGFQTLIIFVQFLEILPNRGLPNEAPRDWCSRNSGVPVLPGSLHGRLIRNNIIIVNNLTGCLACQKY